jgi:ribosomal protein L32E
VLIIVAFILALRVIDLEHEINCARIAGRVSREYRAAIEDEWQAQGIGRTK